ncbi:hypothetical protein DRJ22_03445 [Candidatus Woesearchaeota archaeon]|nr:MAG: hypothetical protein DRJ22_03445 [Candidatus Woesearchaeota archaeon]
MSLWDKIKLLGALSLFTFASYSCGTTTVVNQYNEGNYNSVKIVNTNEETESRKDKEIKKVSKNAQKNRDKLVSDGKQFSSTEEQKPVNETDESKERLEVSENAPSELKGLISNERKKDLIDLTEKAIKVLDQYLPKKEPKKEVEESLPLVKTHAEQFEPLGTKSVTEAKYSFGFLFGSDFNLKENKIKYFDVSLIEGEFNVGLFAFGGNVLKAKVRSDLGDECFNGVPIGISFGLGNILTNLDEKMLNYGNKAFFNLSVNMDYKERDEKERILPLISGDVFEIDDDDFVWYDFHLQTGLSSFEKQDSEFTKPNYFVLLDFNYSLNNSYGLEKLEKEKISGRLKGGLFGKKIGVQAEIYAAKEFFEKAFTDSTIGLGLDLFWKPVNDLKFVASLKFNSSMKNYEPEIELSDIKLRDLEVELNAFIDLGLLYLSPNIKYNKSWFFDPFKNYKEDFSFGLDIYLYKIEG